MSENQDISENQEVSNWIYENHGVSLEVLINFFFINNNKQLNRNKNKKKRKNLFIFVINQSHMFFQPYEHILKYLSSTSFIP